MKKLSKIKGIKILDKNAQRHINGKGQCDTYTGPISYGPEDCEAFHALPPYHQVCVLVSVECFPQ
ncbi:hypothetical protein [Abyssalbus ytuae]|uniref:Uncharacterized protein n=1 Tax=Abyssalbus ytuae TaxID=2926907 RepID=A0A9E6ZYV6_9FLAO|nr:hypothetical protein [Abyssalbus ytuae]UOB17722.1 hypothetical protein MQE35_00140 [Abyssalbus ytuae]